MSYVTVHIFCRYAGLYEYSRPNGWANRDQTWHTRLILTQVVF